MHGLQPMDTLKGNSCIIFYGHGYGYVSYLL